MRMLEVGGSCNSQGLSLRRGEQDFLGAGHQGEGLVEGMCTSNTAGTLKDTSRSYKTGGRCKLQALLPCPELLILINFDDVFLE